MSNATKPSIIVYSATWCGFCHAAKQYLDRLGIAYEERDIEVKQAYAAEAVEKSGQMGIPVLDIAGDIIVGFDRPKIDASLKSHAIA